MDVGLVQLIGVELSPRWGAPHANSLGGECQIAVAQEVVFALVESTLLDYHNCVCDVFRKRVVEGRQGSYGRHVLEDGELSKSPGRSTAAMKVQLVYK